MFGIVSRKKRIQESLNIHATSLIDSDLDIEQDIDPRDADELEGLFRLAEQVATTLTPTDPDSAFVESLRSQLYRMQTSEVENQELWEDRRDRAMRVSRIVGMVISVVAIAAMITRIVSTVVKLIAFITDKRRETTAAV